VRPKWLASEWRDGIGRVTDKTTDCVGVHAQQERDEQVVGVPESLERLLADSVMSGRIHHKHAEKHDMTGDTTGLSVVDLNGQFGTHLCSLDVEEAAGVSTKLKLMV
jgi:hypothetical protein